MPKTDSFLVRQKNSRSSQARCPKSKKETAKTANLVTQKGDDRYGNLTELKAKMRDLIQAALDELQRVRQKTTPKSLENSVQEETPGRGGIRGDQIIDPLDIEMEKLLVIKKWLEETPASIPEQRTSPVGPDVMAPPKRDILIVDDDPTTVKILTHFLEREGYAVTSSHSGVEGLKRASQEKPGLILLDIMIPDLNGFQFLTLLRKNRDLASVPIILLSLLAEESDILKGLESGAVDYIIKPFSPSILLAKIKKYMRLEK